jgi:hypothetical protein
MVYNIIMIGKEGNIMCAQRERAHQIIDSLSDTRIQEVLDYLEYIRIREELDATQEILDDKKLMESIQKGLSQLRAGEIISLDELKNV